MDRRFIPKPKSLIVFLRKKKPHCRKREEQCKGENIVEFSGRRLRRREQQYTYSVDQNIPRISGKYQISEDQDQTEQIKCLHSAIKDCNRSGLLHLILFSHCIRKKTLCR